MTGTTNYGWTLMAESQSQKFQTFNDDLQAIDTELHYLATGGITLVAATDTVLGGIKVGEGLSMAVTSELLNVVYGTSSGTAAEGNDGRITGALQTTGGTMSAALHLSVPGSSDNSDKATSTSWVRTYVTGLGFGTGSGTVTSVALTAPGILSVSGSPVTTTGTLALSLATQSSNLVWAGPATGSAAAPTFRSLVTADMPSGTGTVTSVAMTVPAWLSISGSPVTTSGTLAVTASNQNANIVLAGPSTGGAATPAFRALVAADLPGVSGLLDSAAGSTRGSVLYRGSTAWTALSPGTSGDVLTTNGAGADPTWATPGTLGASSADVQTFTAGGTWTKPSGAKAVTVIVFGAGGSGGGGSGGATSTTRLGGGGGGGGSKAEKTYRASDLSGTVTVTIGAGGSSASGGSSAVGSDGTAGGNSSFGAYLTAYGGGGGKGGQITATAAHGGGGAGSAGAGTSGGTTTGSGAAGAPAPASGNNGVGGNGAIAATPTTGCAEYGGGAGGTLTTGGTPGSGGSSIYGAPGGGGGGSINSANSGSNGATGGNVASYSVGGGGTTTVGNAGTAGSAGDSTKGGQGGGGGAYNTSGTGLAGGNGGVNGGGGGGGGAGTSVGGASGAGGNGVVYVISYF